MLIDISFFSVCFGIVCEKLDDRKICFRGYSFSTLGDNQDDFGLVDSEFDTVKSLFLNTRYENFSHHFLNNPIKSNNRFDENFMIFDQHISSIDIYP